MKNFLFVLVIFVTSFNFAQTFPHLKLGLTKEEIKQTEEGTLVKEYIDKLTFRFVSPDTQYTVTIHYQFEDSIAYMLTWEYTLLNKTPEECMADYNRLKNSLTAQYGTPDGDDEPKWIDEKSAAGLTQAQAIQKGYLTLSTYWLKEKFTVIATVLSLNENMYFGVGFVAKKEVSTTER